jgi:hypothetical protein
MLKKTLLCLFATCCLYGQNQTSYVTYPLPEDSLPYRLSIAQASFSLPAGLQAYVIGLYKGEWLLLAGRTYGLHGFVGDTFPVSSQNTMVYVVNPSTGTTVSRSLTDPSSGLSQEQIDQLSVTNALFFQGNGSNTLYMVGGYGINTATGNRETKSVLTAIDVPHFIKWVKGNRKAKSAAKCLRQVSNPLLQVTGGVMCQSDPHQPYLLGLGQNFIGSYIDTTSNGVYTYQIRPFQVIDTGKSLLVQPYSQPSIISTYRRRDLNIVPILKKVGKSLQQSYVALGGVFTPGADFGAWTVPIEIAPDGSSMMLNPNTFAQGMNNYSCANVGLYSEKTKDMYTLLFGGISFLYSINGGFYVPGGSFFEDFELGFTNDVTTLRIDSSGNYAQYFMSATFPAITPTFGTDPGPELLFGASSFFFTSDTLPAYPNGVIALDKLGSSPVHLGYIVGGIQSSMAETESEIGNVDTHASNYIFTVTLVPVVN